ncbi:MAG: GNAT family N-acetyltransferase [Anaerolineae bacterium]
MTNVIIRAFHPTDLEPLYRLRQMPKAQRDTLQLPFVSFELFQQRFAQPDTNVHSLVAVLADSGELVGNLGLVRQKNPRRAHTGDIGMAVHDDYQGQGIGTKLMAAAVDLADNWLGLTRLELTVFADNSHAIRLYEKFAFKKEGTLRAYAMREGRLVDVYAMARLRV